MIETSCEIKRTSEDYSNYTEDVVLQVVGDSRLRSKSFRDESGNSIRLLIHFLPFEKRLEPSESVVGDRNI